MQVCNTCGQVGYVPENYVQFLCTPKEGSTELDGPACSTPPTGNEAGTSSRGQSENHFASSHTPSQVSLGGRCDESFELLFAVCKATWLNVIGHWPLCL